MKQFFFVAKKFISVLFLFSILFLNLNAPCRANLFGNPNSDSPSDEENLAIRQKKTYGVDLGLGQPFLSIFGAMVGLNLGNTFRVSVGGGTLIYWESYQANLKVFTSDENFAWFFGGGITYLNGTPGDLLGKHLDFESLVTPHIETGLDYTSEIGFHMNFNVGVGIPGSQIIVYPGLAFGWFF